MSQVTQDPAAERQRQALAGMLWSKQFYYCEIEEWLDGDPLGPPPPPGRERGRNSDWRHLRNAELCCAARDLDIQLHILAERAPNPSASIHGSPAVVQRS